MIISRCPNYVILHKETYFQISKKKHDGKTNLFVAV